MEVWTGRETVSTGRTPCDVSTEEGSLRKGLVESFLGVVVVVVGRGESAEPEDIGG